MDYNTQRKHLVLPEYGRNIHKMVAYAMEIEDDEKRNNTAKAIIQVMGNMNPHLRDIHDFKHKLWDHLAIISDFKLEIESPYPTPVRETFEEKPKRIPYSSGKIRYRHFGRVITQMIKKAVEMEEGEEKERLTEVILNHMKKTYLMWNKDAVEDEVIFEALRELSKGELKIKEGLVLNTARDYSRPQRRKQNYPHKQQGGRRDNRRTSK